MAKSKSTSDQPGKVKIRVIEFEVEGSDVTMQEGLKSITAALNRGMAPPSSYSKMKYVQAPPQEFEDGSSSGEAEDDEDNNFDAVDVVAQAPKKSASSRKPRSMKLLEINFGDVMPPLKEFASEKSPKTDMHRYLVIAYWFKHYKSTPDVTPDHFFTAYRHLQWSVPSDPSAAIKDLRHRRRTQFSPGSSHGTSTINHVGEEIVLAMGRDK